MSHRSNFLKVLSGEKPDRIPMIFMGFWDEKSMHRLAPPNTYDENTYCNPCDDPPHDGFSSEPRTMESRQRAVNLAKYLGMATIGVGKGGVLPFGHGGPGEIQPTVIERREDCKILSYEGGHRRMIHYNPHSIRYYHFPVKEEADLERLELPDMRDSRRFQDIEEDCRLFKQEGFVPTGSIQGFFSGIHNSFMDFEDTLVNLMLEPEFMHRFTEILANMSLDAVDMLMDRGVEVIDVCDDLGNESGLLMSPELFRTFFLDWYDELVTRVHRKGGYVHLHSHGNIRPLMADLAHIKVDIINPFDWAENPDLPDLVKTYGRDIVFCGGSTGDQHARSMEEKRRVAERACGLAKIAERGYIYMANQPSPDVEQEDWEYWKHMIHGILASSAQDL